jgi:hypothetical protein
MGQLLTPSLVETLRSAVTAFFSLIGDFKSTVLCKAGSNQGTGPSAQVNSRAPNCRVQLTKQKKDNNLEENTQRAKILAVRLAFAVGAADDQLPDCEVELIKNWAY